MRLYIFFLLLLAACNDENSQQTEPRKDTAVAPPPKARDTATQVKPSEPKTYGNARFKNVTVTKTAENEFLVKGEGQIFEASFGWVIEDGHDELKQGHEMTDAGAPAWGKFSFTVKAEKKRPNSTLHLILFETSAKDGSRQYELPVALH
ncbi:MAG: Gmad2 immunoglobulin-like domain-containing protein [Chitinophagaceae bacterium]|nr:Gmad2 immunoglobulin-like domain-containing protein [Chitinophagaceae bacterium]